MASRSIPYNNMQGPNKKQSPQEILKRIQAESAEKKRERTIELLNRESDPISGNSGARAKAWWASTWERLQVGMAGGKKKLLRMSRVKENRHIAIITLFFTGAMWISWQVEDKYDKLRRRARSSKSMKEKQVESENEYINKMLARTPFSAVPIEEEEEEDNSYIFQKADIEFDTRADLMEVLEEQKQLLYQDE